MSVMQTDPPRAEAPEPDPPRRARPSAEVLLLAAGVVAALVVFVVWQTYPNYDTYYTLVWGQELFHGHLPDYDVFRTPTPHPLSTLVAWAIAPFGTAGDRILVLVALLGYVGFLAVMFAFTKRLLGRAIARRPGGAAPARARKRSGRARPPPSRAPQRRSAAARR